jgi:hypothetical protein
LENEERTEFSWNFSQEKNVCGKNRKEKNPEDGQIPSLFCGTDRQKYPPLHRFIYQNTSMRVTYDLQR